MRRAGSWQRDARRERGGNAAPAEPGQPPPPSAARGLGRKVSGRGQGSASRAGERRRFLNRDRYRRLPTHYSGLFRAQPRTARAGARSAPRFAHARSGSRAPALANVPPPVPRAPPAPRGFERNPGPAAPPQLRFSRARPRHAPHRGLPSRPRAARTAPLWDRGPLPANRLPPGGARLAEGSRCPAAGNKGGPLPSCRYSSTWGSCCPRPARGRRSTWRGAGLQPHCAASRRHIRPPRRPRASPRRRAPRAAQRALRKAGRNHRGAGAAGAGLGGPARRKAAGRRGGVRGGEGWARGEPGARGHVSRGHAAGRTRGRGPGERGCRFPLRRKRRGCGGGHKLPPSSARGAEPRRPETKGRAQRGARGPARRAAAASALRAPPRFTLHSATAGWKRDLALSLHCVTHSCMEK